MSDSPFERFPEVTSIEGKRTIIQNELNLLELRVLHALNEGPFDTIDDIVNYFKNKAFRYDHEMDQYVRIREFAYAPNTMTHIKRPFQIIHQKLLNRLLEIITRLKDSINDSRYPDENILELFDRLNRVRSISQIDDDGSILPFVNSNLGRDVVKDIVLTSFDSTLAGLNDIPDGELAELLSIGFDIRSVDSEIHPKISNILTSQGITTPQDQVNFILLIDHYYKGLVSLISVFTLDFADEGFKNIISNYTGFNVIFLQDFRKYLGLPDDLDGWGSAW